MQSFILFLLSVFIDICVLFVNFEKQSKVSRVVG